MATEASRLGLLLSCFESRGQLLGMFCCEEQWEEGEGAPGETSRTPPPPPALPPSCAGSFCPTFLWNSVLLTGCQRGGDELGWVGRPRAGAALQGTAWQQPRAKGVGECQKQQPPHRVWKAGQVGPLLLLALGRPAPPESDRPTLGDGDSRPLTVGGCFILPALQRCPGHSLTLFAPRSLQECD